MELSEYARVLRREKALVLLPVFAALLLTSAVAVVRGPTYTSTAVIYVAEPGGSAGTAGQRLNAYVKLAGSRRVAAVVASRLGQPRSVAHVQKAITARADPASLLLTVDAVGSSPGEAQQLAAATADELLGLSRRLEPGGAESGGAPRLIVAQQASAGTPQSSVTAAGLLLAAVLGLFIGCLFALWREALQAPLRSEADLERSSGGLRSLGTAALDTSSVARLLAAVLSSRQPPPTRLLVTSAVAGQGASQVAGHLALMAVRAGNRAVLVCSSTESQALLRDWGLVERPGLAEVITAKLPLHDALQPHRQERLSVLAPGALGEEAQALMLGVRFNQLLDALAADYDLVVVVSPPVAAPGDVPAPFSGQRGGVVLVARAGRAGGRALSKAVALLQDVSADVLGTVLVVKSRGPWTTRSAGDEADPRGSTPRMMKGLHHKQRIPGNGR